MTLYHITKAKHLDSILTEGLRPNSGRVGICPRSAHQTYRMLYKSQPLFLTDDWRRAARDMLTPEWVRMHRPVILEVDVDGLDISDAGEQVTPTLKAFAHEYRCDEAICPSRISVLTRVE